MRRLSICFRIIRIFEKFVETLIAIYNVPTRQRMNEEDVRRIILVNVHLYL